MENKETLELGLFEIITLGIKTLLGEIFWTILKGLRQWEICDLRKRLNEEYIKFGKLTIHDPKNKKEIQMCKDQIKFLEEEIEFLEGELNKIREDILKNRRAALDL